MTRQPKLPAWAPVALAAALGIGIYGLWMRPTQARVADADQQLQQSQQQAGALQAQILRDQAMPAVPLPITKAMFDRLWPDVVTRAQAAGYTLQGVTFTAPPRSPTSGPSGASAPGTGEDAVTPLEVTARFTGQYLPLDETLSRMQSVLPLWSWRSVLISPQQGTGEISITVSGVVPVHGRIRSVRAPAARRAAPPVVPPPPGSQP